MIALGFKYQSLFTTEQTLMGVTQFFGIEVSPMADP